MQPDVGGAWRQDVLRRMREEQQAKAAERPTPPRRSRRLRRSPPAVTQTELEPAEIDLTETVNDAVVLPEDPSAPLARR